MRGRPSNERVRYVGTRSLGKDEAPLISLRPTALRPVPLARYSDDRDLLVSHFLGVRAETERLASPLSEEDQVVQSMPDASPTKWHRAHVTWFFETFVVAPNLPGYDIFDPAFGYLFNSYYEAVGERQFRPERGLLTRPENSRVTAYRGHVDDAFATLARKADDATWRRVTPLTVLGLHHEQQHQELLLMDILHAFSRNALHPAYRPYRPAPALSAPESTWFEHPGGNVEIGHRGAGFAFDNEGPRHAVHLEPFRLASRLVTNAEWKEFMADDGYARPEFWLMDGIGRARDAGWRAPGYWRQVDGVWHQMTLEGLIEVNDQAPVCHVSYYEADAFARWSGHRLPTEAEWEVFAAEQPIEGNLSGTGFLRPRPALADAERPRQMFGDVWEWTASPYCPYPGFRTAAGAVGEYNGKFMVNQMVLRGGCLATPEGHVRPTYRNFFYPHMRWTFAGLRIASDAR